MTADEIRKEFKWDSLEPDHAALLHVQAVSEVAAQIAEFNESRKPRWVNLTNTQAPCLVDATQVVGVSSGKSTKSGEHCDIVFVRCRAHHGVWLRSR